MKETVHTLTRLQTTEHERDFIRSITVALGELDRILSFDHTSPNVPLTKKELSVSLKQQAQALREQLATCRLQIQKKAFLANETADVLVALERVEDLVTVAKQGAVYAGKAQEKNTVATFPRPKLP